MTVTITYHAAGLKCPACGSDTWKEDQQSIRCLSCEATYTIDEGVLRMDASGKSDDITQLYSAMGGTHFVDTSFESNPLIYITTRAYRRFIEKHFSQATGSLMDFGCGDGRFSLWAAERSFSTVVAVDSNLPSLKRLASEARTRKLEQVVVVCADLKNPPFKRDYFDAVLCVEVLYYLIPSLGRAGALQAPSNLLSKNGKMVLSEFSRFGRAIIDLDAMDITNARSLIATSHRWEKFGDMRIESYQWSVSELRSDLSSVHLKIIDEAGVSLAAPLFSYAWNFTSYPLRPRLDADLRTVIETICDNTDAAIDATRNVVFALEKNDK